MDGAHSNWDDFTPEDVERLIDEVKEHQEFTVERSRRAAPGSGDNQRRILRKEYLFAFRYGSKEYTEEEWRELEQSADAYAEMQLRRVICRRS